MPAGTPDTAFVTGGSGFIGGRLRRSGSPRAAPRSARSPARSGSAAAVEELGAEPVRGDLDDVERDGRRGRGLRGRPSTSPPTSPTGARARSSSAATSTGTEQRARGEPPRRRAPLRPLRHRGGDPRRPAAPRRRRVGAAAPRLAGALLRDQGGGRAARARGERRRVRDGRRAPALRLGRRRHDAAAGDRRRRSRPAASRWIDGGRHRTSITHVDNVVEGLLPAPSGAAAARPTSSPTASRSSSASSSPSCCERRASSPPTATSRLARAARSPPAARPPGRLLPLKGSPPLTRFASGPASQECTLDDSKARSELGYEPVISREEGWRS